MVGMLAKSIRYVCKEQPTNKSNWIMKKLKYSNRWMFSSVALTAFSVVYSAQDFCRLFIHQDRHILKTVWIFSFSDIFHLFRAFWISSFWSILNFIFENINYFLEHFEFHLWKNKIPLTILGDILFDSMYLGCYSVS